MPTYKRAAVSFLNSRLFPIAVAVTVFICHTVGADLVGAGVLLFLSLHGFLFADDLRFVLPVSMAVICLVSVKNSPAFNQSETPYDQALVPILLAVFAGIFLLGLIYFMVRLRKKALPLRFNGQMLALAAFSLALALNGLFTGGAVLKNLLFGLTVALSFIGVYLLISLYLPRSRETQEYFLFSMLALALMICAQLVVAYFTTVKFSDDFSPIKESIVLGWGAWTNIGAYLALLLPAPFYFAATDERRPWLWFLFCVLVFGGIVLSGSRGALLFGAITFLLCLLLLFIKAKNKKQSRLSILVLCLFGLASLFLLREQLLSVLSIYIKQGFSDSGRFALWKGALEAFGQGPIFGVGFYDLGIEVSWVGETVIFPDTCHNTFLQLLSATGIVGLGLYLYHRVQTVRLFFKTRKSVASVCLLLSMLALVLCSFLDEHLFHIYPAFCYVYALYLAETPQEESL